MALAECCIASGSRGRRADGGSAAVPRRRRHAAGERAAARRGAVRRGPVAGDRHLRARRRRRARRPGRRPAADDTRYGRAATGCRSPSPARGDRPARRRAAPSLRVAAPAARLSLTCVERAFPRQLRRVRHLRPGPRRRPAHLLRPLRPAASRPGERRHRGGRRGPDHGRQRHGSGLAGLQRKGARRADRHARHRSRALLHDRRDRLAELPAAHALARRAHHRPGPQRQPRQHDRAARRAAPAGRRVQVRHRHRGHHRAHRPARRQRPARLGPRSGGPASAAPSRRLC